MATHEPQDGTPPARTTEAAGDTQRHRDAVGPEGQGPRKGRNPWIWISAALVLVVAGLLIWALNTQSDLDSAEQDVAQLQSQASQSKETGGEVVAAFKAAYDSVTQQLGAKNEDLATTEQDLKEAERSAAKAEEDAAAAKEDVAQAENETAKATAEAEQAQAEAQAAESKAAIAADCAKAYLSAFGALFEGDSVSAQASVVQEDIRGITDTCKAALAGT